MTKVRSRMGPGGPTATAPGGRTHAPVVPRRAALESKVALSCAASAPANVAAICACMKTSMPGTSDESNTVQRAAVQRQGELVVLMAGCSHEPGLANVQRPCSWTGR